MTVGPMGVARKAALLVATAGCSAVAVACWSAGPVAGATAHEPYAHRPSKQDQDAENMATAASEAESVYAAENNGGFSNNGRAIGFGIPWSLHVERGHVTPHAGCDKLADVPGTFVVSSTCNFGAPDAFEVQAESATSNDCFSVFEDQGGTMGTLVRWYNFDGTCAVPRPGGLPLSGHAAAHKGRHWYTSF